MTGHRHKRYREGTVKELARSSKGTGQKQEIYRSGPGRNSRGGQTPWLVGRPADGDRISDIRSKVLNYRNFLKIFSKQSKPKHRSNSRHSIETVELSKFFAKKKNDLDINTDCFQRSKKSVPVPIAPPKFVFTGYGGERTGCVGDRRSLSVGLMVHLAPDIAPGWRAGDGRFPLTQFEL